MVRVKEIEQKRPLIIPQQEEAKVINCRISEGKLITQLDDEREIIIAVSSLTKWSILGKNTKPEQLEKWELQNEGRYIYFPIIDEILPAWIISKGLNASCLD